jgi:hypothetical protein
LLNWILALVGAGLTSVPGRVKKSMEEEEDCQHAHRPPDRIPRRILRDWAWKNGELLFFPQPIFLRYN